MVNDMESRERLEEILEKSDLYYAQDGEAWTTRRGEADVRFTQVGHLVRASAGTGVLANAQNRVALRAMCDHMEGWQFKIAFFEVPAEGEVTVFYDREIGSEDSPDSMAKRLMYTYADAVKYLRRVAAGESPHRVCGDDDLPDLASLIRDRGDLAGLLGS